MLKITFQSMLTQIRTFTKNSIINVSSKVNPHTIENNLTDVDTLHPTTATDTPSQVTTGQLID